MVIETPRDKQTLCLPHELGQALSNRKWKWLVTGAAGFIGSNLVECLLHANQVVVGLDNFSTGHQRNLDEILRSLSAQHSQNFQMIEGDIRDRANCSAAVKGVEIVLHQAALGSVPRSIADPLTTHDVNVTGFLNMLDAARLEGVSRFIYAASSSTYGDEPNLPKREERIGNPLSPYAVTKFADEIYASVYARTYDFKATGLRYFNVFGRRQDPDGPYAAVIPRWVDAMIHGQVISINGDGETSRDFCYVANAVQANIAAALASLENQGEVYNVAVGARTTLNDLFKSLREGLSRHQIHYDQDPTHVEFRDGDVRHSEADISKARQRLGYEPSHRVGQGLADALPWYIRRAKENV